MLLICFNRSYVNSINIIVGHILISSNFCNNQSPTSVESMSTILVELNKLVKCVIKHNFRGWAIKDHSNYNTGLMKLLSLGCI